MFDVVLATETLITQPVIAVYPRPGGELLGFTPSQARTYLSLSGWPFPAIAEETAGLLAAHPMALSLLVSYAQAPGVDAIKIAEIVQSVPHVREDKIIEEVCPRILDHILKQMTSDQRLSLNLASTYLDSFTMHELTGLIRATRTKIDKLWQCLRGLDRRSLLVSYQPAFEMHGLVRRYVQQLFRSSAPRLYRDAHQTVGENYFPLIRHKKQKYADDHDIALKYADPASCALALFHFEKAENSDAQHAVIENVYETDISRAKEYMHPWNTAQKSTYAFWKAEQALRKALRVYTPPGSENVDPQDIPRDINRLMATALVEQHNPDKYQEAVLHFRQAVLKGAHELVPQLISTLCLITQQRTDTANECTEWKEAQERFAEIREAVRRAYPGSLPSNYGETYDKIINTLMGIRLDDRSRCEAQELIDEALAAELTWDGLYEAAYRLAVDAGEHEPEKWLAIGLAKLPRSERLWIPYCITAAERGLIEELPTEWRRERRGVDAVTTVLKAVCQKGLDQALKLLLSDALAVEDKHAELYKQIGALLEIHGRLKEAEDVYRKGTHTVLNSHDCHIALGRLLERHGRLKEAEDVYRKGTHTVLNSHDCHIALGRLLEQKEQWDEAERVYVKGIRAGGNAPECYLALGRLLEKQERLKDAEDVYRKGTDIADNAPQCYVALGRLLEQKQRLNEAEHIYKNGIRSVPAAPDCYLALGALLEQKQRWDEAEKVYRSGKHAIPNTHQFYLSLGALLEGRGRLKQAEDVYREGNTQTQRADTFVSRLARVLEMQGHFEESEHLHKTQVGLQPDVPSVISGYAQYKDRRGETDIAKQMLEDFCTRIPNNAHANLTLGQLCEMEAPERTERYYRKALEFLQAKRSESDQDVVSLKVDIARAHSFLTRLEKPENNTQACVLGTGD